MDDRKDDPVQQVLSCGPPYPLVVVGGDYWMEGDSHRPSVDANNRPIFPMLDLKCCALDEQESIYNYRRNFAGKEHMNYVGEDVQHGPLLLSVYLDLSTDDEICDHFLVLLRIKRRTIFRSIPCNSLASESPGPRDFMRYILGEEPDVDRFHPVALPRISDDIIRFDEHTASSCHKIGVLYQTSGQINEEDYLQNQVMSPAFKEFMDLIGDIVTLKDFPNYRGGLDVKYGQTGDYSYYTTFKNRELMFHVAPLLPFTPNDSQQLARKRHIGNDVVCIVFQEHNTPFSPSSIRSHVLHNFIVVQVENPNSEDTYYKVSVAAKEGVPKYGPYLPNPCVFKKGPDFRYFLLTKVLNAEASALKCEKFLALAERTRSTLLEQLVNDLILRNERLLDNAQFINDLAATDSPQKTGFLSNFRSALRNGRSGNSTPTSADELKHTKNIGQSLSLNDLTLLSLEAEDGKKDIKISSKEKKRMKKKSTLMTNSIPMLKSQLSLINGTALGLGNDASPTSPKTLPRSMVQLDPLNMNETRESRAKSTSFVDDCTYQCDIPTATCSLPRNVSLSTSAVHTNSNKAPSTLTKQNVSLSTSAIHTNLSKAPSTPTDQNGHCSPKSILRNDPKETLNQLSSELASAHKEIERLKTEVSKLQLDKMDLIRQNVIHQREVKKLNERQRSFGSEHSTPHRKEKRRSDIVVSSTEFV